MVREMTRLRHDQDGIILDQIGASAAGQLPKDLILRAFTQQDSI